MSENKHTPGPWELSQMTGFVYAGEHRELLIATCQSGPECYKFTDEELQNARLIAAAPELLEVAQSILADDMLQYLPAEYVAKVRAAIVKATGSAA